MTTYKKITLFFIFLLLNSLIFAQDTLTTKTLYLKDGSFLLGSIIEKSTEVYVWRLTDGTQITLPADQVLRIEEQRKDFRYFNKGKIKQIKGLYGYAMIGGLFEKKHNEWSQEDHAISVNFSVGYHLNSKISVGLGTGYDDYNVAIIPLYFELRGDLLDKSVTPYYKISAGYGFTAPTLVQKDNEQASYKGGILVHPSIGLKFYTRMNQAWLIDFGYRFQRYNEQFVWDSSPLRWTLRRTTLRIGLEF